MARTTTKATTKPKAKSTKKPAVSTRSKAAAAKTTRATKTAKVTKPAAVKKAPAVKPANTTKVTVVKRSVTESTLRRLNLLKALVFAGLAGAAAYFMNATSYSLTVGHAAKDELIALTQGTTQFVSGSESLFDIELRWVVVGIMAIAALLSLLAATRLRRRYEAAAASGISSMRWIGWGVTTALMMATIALVSGVSDIWTLKVIAGLMIATCALAWVAEKRVVQAGRPIFSEFNVSLLTGSLPWIIILGYALSTWVWGLIRYPWFVYALYVSMIVGFMLLTANQYKRITGWKNTLVLDRNYLVIGLATKAAFAIILILGLQK